MSTSGEQTAIQRRFSVLLVEDDRADAVLVEELIADSGADIQVVWAPSMEAAERQLTVARPDCVLLDLNLPDADGIKALDQVAKRDHTMPIVVLTGLNDEHFGVSAVAAGRAGLPGQGPRRARHAAPRAAVRGRTQARRADRGRVARQ